jgi:hypothetical protein
VRNSATRPSSVLSDPLAKGLRRANFTKSLGDWVRKPEDERVFTEVGPIVSVELWEQCNAILASQKKNTQKTGKRPKWLFAGKVVCGTCINKMYVPGFIATMRSMSAENVIRARAIVIRRGEFCASHPLVGTIPACLAIIRINKLSALNAW